MGSRLRSVPHRYRETVSRSALYCTCTITIFVQHIFTYAYFHRLGQGACIHIGHGSLRLFLCRCTFGGRATCSMSFVKTIDDNCVHLTADHLRLDITHGRLSNLIIDSLRIKGNICLTAANVLETACLDTVTKKLGNPISQMN